MMYQMVTEGWLKSLSVDEQERPGGRVLMVTKTVMYYILTYSIDDADTHYDCVILSLCF